MVLRMPDDLDSLTFAAEVRGAEPGLARANLLLAREVAYPRLRLGPYLAQLDAWAAAARDRMPRSESPLGRAVRLAQYLFDEVGLAGNTEEYDDPRNSYLNEVMERGAGLPIALSAIFLEVAGRIALPAEGIGLPGHFIVAVREGGLQHFLDPFHGGMPLERDDMAALVRRITGYEGGLRPEWLQPQPPRAILARMLFNLRGVYAQREAWPQALAVLERLRLLQPIVPDHLRDIGLLRWRAGARRAAVEALESYLLAAPAAPDAGQVQQSLNALLAELARLN